MRASSMQHRKQFARGAIVGLTLVAFKFLVYLPLDIADLFYGASLLITLVITAGDIFELRYFVVEAKYLDLVAGFLFPLDAYAVLILMGVPLTN